MQRIYRQIKTKLRQTKGFTLVEMLVVAPLVVLVIATLVGFMITLVGNVFISNARVQMQYDTQAALNQIEQDAFYSTTFLGSFTPTSPQGKDNGTQAFSSTNNDIIFNAPATDKNPFDPTRQIVYYANDPSPCSGQVQVNNPLYTKSIYFLSTVNGVTSLYRREIVAPNDQSSNIDSNTTCTAPWQRNSCVSINYNSNPICVSKDSQLVSYVSALTVAYYNNSDPNTILTDPTQADSVKISITVTRTIGGDTISTTMSLAASRADTTQIIPT